MSSNMQPPAPPGPVPPPRPRPGDTDDGVMKAVLPVGRTGLSIAAGYAGLLALFIVPAPLALVLGIWAAVDLRKHPEKSGMGRAIFAIVAGVLGTAVLVPLLANYLSWGVI